MANDNTNAMIEYRVANSSMNSHPRRIEFDATKMVANDTSKVLLDDREQYFAQKQAVETNPALKVAYGHLSLMWSNSLAERFENQEKCNSALANAYAGFVGFLANSPELIEDDDVILVQKKLFLLSCYYGTKKGHVGTEVYLRNVSPYHLFKAFHHFGMGDELQKTINEKGLLQNFRAAYPAWVKKNKDFIDAQKNTNAIQLTIATDINPDHVVKPAHPKRKDFDVLKMAVPSEYDVPLHERENYFIQKQNATSNKDLKDAYRHLSIIWAANHQELFERFGSKSKYKSALGNAYAGLVKILAESPEVFEEKDTLLIQKTLYSLVYYDGSEDTKNDRIGREAFFLNMPPYPLFKALYHFGMDGEIQTAIDKKIFPQPIRTAYPVWVKKNKEFIDALKTGETSSTDSNVPTEIMQLPVMVEEVPVVGIVDSRVTEITVDHPLVTRGKRTEGMGYRPVDEAEQLEAGASDDDLNRNRTETIKHALLKDAASGVRHLTIRRDVRQIDCKTGRPYNLIDVDMEDGTRSRIAVCDYVGNMTFVERDAPEYNGEVFDLETLRKKSKVWHVAHLNDTQWIEGIQEVLYTPLDQMSPALKNKSYWYSLGDIGVQSLVTKFMIAGRAPPTVDTKTLIDCGPLEGRSKFSLLYSAWNRGSIKGFEKGTTFTTVLRSLIEGEDAPMPWLKKFENKPQLTAATILEASARFEREWGFAVRDGFYDELMIDHVDIRIKKDEPDLCRTGTEADMAFKFRAVAINSDDVEAWGRYPDSLDDFLKLSGYAIAMDREVA